MFVGLFDFIIWYTTTANETQLTYYILIEDTADALYLDDAFVREKGTEKNLIKNGSFDETYPEGQYYAFEESVINSFEKTFAKLEKSNISGIYGAAPHYVPSFLKRDYPDIVLPEQYSSFSTWNTHHPKLLEMYEIFYKSVIPRIKDYESFDGVIVANEPQWNTRVSSYAYIDDFRAKMQEKYVTIDTLNKRWGTQYSSFDEVEMPDSNLDTTPQWHDWREYNDTILPEFVGHISDYIKAIDPDVFTSVKIMDTFGRQSNFRIWGSNNFEVLKDYEDINGCDAWSLIDTYDIRWKNVFYDFLTSVKNAPIYNSEDHIIIDAPKLTYRDDEVKYNIVDLWNGAVHGRGGSILWLWDRSDRTKNGTIYFNSLLTARPDSVATLGKTTLDINRLSKEIVALQDTPSNVGILYSQNSVPYSDEMLDIIKSVSAYLGENGQKTRFVVESDSDKMFDYGMMIVPNSVSITEQTFEKLKKFVANGGTLLIIGDDALTVNEYGDAFNKSDVDAIKNKSVTMSFEDAGTSISGESKKELRKVITQLVEKNGYDRVKIVDKATGEKITEGDFISAEYDGAFIINFCNYECGTSNSIDRRSIFKKAELNLKKGETVTFEKITSYATSRDFEYISASQADEVLYGDGKRYLCDALRCGYDVLKRRDSDVRAKYWEENLACVDSGNDFIDRAVVFAQYHLSIMASPDDNRLGIGAKGLSGMGYMGHSFWDTELFLFPYYLYTRPDTSRRLLEYRYRLIDVAKVKAKKHGYLGAMYPWESAWIDDGEACLEYGDLDLVTGKRRKFEMAETEIHITAGIAYAVWQYYIATGDDEFMEKCGNELVVLTALFFASRACFKNGRYEICGVIGPDEYKENVDNNAYTNYMVHRNLRIADRILKNCPKELKGKLDAEYGFEPVCRRISEVLEGLYLPKEESDGIISQFDGCKNLKPIDIEHYKKLGKVCAIFGDYGFDEILKMQVYKQADLVMLFYVMDELFSIDSMRRNFEYYEKRTIHDSSLSLCIHSLVAARLKMYGLADDMFYRSCCVDIGDNTDNSDEGIHSASIGGIWLALVMGYGGVKVNENGFFVNAVLPEGWNMYSFFMTYRNTRFKLTVTRDGCTAERIYGQPVPICVNGEEITV